MAGNLSKQPFMKDQKFEIEGDLNNADYITNNSFFIGSHPHISQEARQHVVDVFKRFFINFHKEEVFKGIIGHE